MVSKKQCSVLEWCEVERRTLQGKLYLKEGHNTSVRVGPKSHMR